MNRFIASWLVLLILSPFTAPFSTCDLASAVGLSDQEAPIDAPLTVAAAAATDAAPVTTVFARVHRVKLALIEGERPATSSSIRRFTGVGPAHDTSSNLAPFLFGLRV